MNRRVIFLYKGLVQSVSQLSTSLELGHLLGSNLNLLLRSGVDTLASRALAYAECSETNQGNLVTSNECILDSSNSCLKSLLSINLSDLSTCCNLLN